MVFQWTWTTFHSTFSQSVYCDHVLPKEKKNDCSSNCKSNCSNHYYSNDKSDLTSHRNPIDGAAARQRVFPGGQKHGRSDRSSTNRCTGPGFARYLADRSMDHRPDREFRSDPGGR